MVLPNALEVAGGEVKKVDEVGSCVAAFVSNLFLRWIGNSAKHTVEVKAQ
jgi:hypothetical protein